MERKAPISLVDLLSNWLERSFSRVKWGGFVSEKFFLRTGVNQGSVLAPILFAVFIDNILCLCNKSGFGHILVYADDIILLARSRHCLNELLSLVRAEVSRLNLEMNYDKCSSIRFGSNFDVHVEPLLAGTCNSIKWCDEICYLGVHLVAGRKLKFSVADAKRKFNKSCNAVLSKVLCTCNHVLTMHLLHIKCLPSLLYGVEAMDLTSAQLQSMDFVYIRFAMKVFRLFNRQSIMECLNFMHIELPSVLVARRRAKFLCKLRNAGNSFCKLVCVV